MHGGYRLTGDGLVGGDQWSWRTCSDKPGILVLDLLATHIAH